MSKQIIISIMIVMILCLNIATAHAAAKNDVLDTEIFRSYRESVSISWEKEKDPAIYEVRKSYDLDGEYRHMEYINSDSIFLKRWKRDYYVKIYQYSWFGLKKVSKP